MTAKLAILYVNLTNPPLDPHHRSGRGIYAMPRVRRFSAAAHHHRRVHVEAIFGDTIPEQRGVSIALPFSRRDGGLHDGQATRTNSKNRPGTYHFVPHVSNSTWLDLPGWRMSTGSRDLRSQPATSAHSRYPSSIDNVTTPKRTF